MRNKNLAAIIAITINGCTPPEGSFAYAQQHAEERQHYLETLAQKGQLPPTQIFYDPAFKKARAFLKQLKAEEADIDKILAVGIGGFFTPFSINNMGRYLPWPVFVDETIFTGPSYTADEEVQCALWYHEGTHLYEMYQGIQIGDERFDHSIKGAIIRKELRAATLGLIGEFNAYQAELDAIEQKKCKVREVWKRESMRRRETVRIRLIQEKRTATPFETRLITNTLKR